MRRAFVLVALATVTAGGPAGLGGPAKRMDELQTAALATMVRAVNAGDAHAYARLYAPSAAITIHGGGVLQGRAAIQAHEVDLLRQYPGARLGFRSIWQKGSVGRRPLRGERPDARRPGHGARRPPLLPVPARRA